jgi:TatD DNase family protein
MNGIRFFPADSGVSAMWIDSHAHLDRLPEADVAAFIAEAEAAGVSPILSTATDCASAEVVVQQCRAFPNLFGAAGISPFDSVSLPERWESRLRMILADKKMVGVGEIGLDASNPRYPSLGLQTPVFVKQLEIARELDLPVIVHSRGAEKKAAEICAARGVTKAMFHCFTGPVDALHYILDQGYSISISGIVTFSVAVQYLVTHVPLDRLFIETDSPYLAPVPHRGKTNRPAWVAITGECVAAVKKITPAALQQVIEENFDNLFGRKGYF